MAVDEPAADAEATTSEAAATPPAGEAYIVLDGAKVAFSNTIVTNTDATGATTTSSTNAIQNALDYISSKGLTSATIMVEQGEYDGGITLSSSSLTALSIIATDAGTDFLSSCGGVKVNGTVDMTAVDNLNLVLAGLYLSLEGLKTKGSKIEIYGTAEGDIINVTHSGGALSIYGGDGGDTISVTDSGGNVTIDGGGGGDRITFSSTATAETAISILCGDGDDSVDLSGTGTGNDITVSGGDGADSFTVAGGMAANSLNIDCGDGGDTVTLSGSVSSIGTLTLAGGDGDDTLNAATGIGKSVTFAGDGGYDLLNLTGAYADGMSVADVTSEQQKKDADGHLLYTVSESGAEVYKDDAGAYYYSDSGDAFDGSEADLTPVMETVTSGAAVTLDGTSGSEVVITAKDTENFTDAMSAKTEVKLNGGAGVASATNNVTGTTTYTVSGVTAFSDYTLDADTVNAVVQTAQGAAVPKFVNVIIDNTNLLDTLIFAQKGITIDKLTADGFNVIVRSVGVTVEGELRAENVSIECSDSDTAISDAISDSVSKDFTGALTAAYKSAGYDQDAAEAAATEKAGELGGKISDFLGVDAVGISFFDVSAKAAAEIKAGGRVLATGRVKISAVTKQISSLVPELPIVTANASGSISVGLNVNVVDVKVANASVTVDGLIAAASIALCAKATASASATNEDLAQYYVPVALNVIVSSTNVTIGGSLTSTKGSVNISADTVITASADAQTGALPLAAPSAGRGRHGDQDRRRRGDHLRGGGEREFDEQCRRDNQGAQSAHRERHDDRRHGVDRTDADIRSGRLQVRGLLRVQHPY
jgi:hypothetical protein